MEGNEGFTDVGDVLRVGPDTYTTKGRLTKTRRCTRQPPVTVGGRGGAPGVDRRNEASGGSEPRTTSFSHSTVEVIMNCIRPTTHPWIEHFTVLWIAER